jgi:hypothetical protein
MTSLHWCLPGESKEEFSLIANNSGIGRNYPISLGLVIKKTKD